MKAEIFGQSDSRIWNDIVKNSNCGTLFHTWEWLKIIEKNTGSNLYPLVFFDNDHNDQPFGAIPLFFMKKMGLKMVFSPPPGTSVTLGPVLVNKDYKQHELEIAYVNFQEYLDRFLRTLNANYTYIVTSPGLLDVRPFSWSHYNISPNYTYKIDLSRGEKELWSNLSGRIKSKINHTRKLGVRIIKNQQDKQNVVDQLYNSIAECYGKQHMTLSFKKPYLQNIVDQFYDTAVRIYLAEYQGHIEGVQMYSVYNDIISLWVGSIRPETNDLEVNGLLLWEIIIDGISQGFRWFENMGANTRHLCDYKSKFDPATQIYFEIKKTDPLGSLAEKAYLWRRGNRSEATE